MSGKEPENGDGSEDAETSPFDEGADNEEKPESVPSADEQRIDLVEEELRETEDRIDEIRDELEPRIREKEEEVADLRAELKDELAEHERRIDELRDEVDGIGTTESSGSDDRSDRPAKAAGVLLGAVGFLGLVGSAATAAVFLIDSLSISFLDTLAREAVFAGVFASVIISLLVIAGGWWSYTQRRWYSVFFAAVVCAVFVSPLGLPALLLVALAEPRFE